MEKEKKITLTTTQIIMLSFLALILLGSVLLVLPISAADGKSVGYLDALFTATTATCVTGLVTLTTATAWSGFGQAVILVLIQIGGLGVITVASWILLLLNKKIGLKDSVLLQDSFNLNTLSGMGEFLKKVVIGTLIVEGIGALAYMLVFVPAFGAQGIWISIFNAVSAFCNAGMDVLAVDSLCSFATNPIINLVTDLLIVLGGLGYIVWWDVLRVFKNFKTEKFRCLSKLTLHSKIVLSVTGILIFVGAAIFFAAEYNNPLTLQGYSLYDKIQLSFFQSITTRTAGFATIPQENLTNVSAITSIVLMFIGGSPVGTAGGIKTITFAILAVSAFCTVRNKDEATLFQRDIPKQAISKAVAVTFLAFLIVFVSSLLLSFVMDAPALDVLYETVSAAATVGLSRNLTGTLGVWGKLIITATMYLGRVGPISLAVAFNMKKENENIIKNPTEEISVG